jgi:hypothetical protein
LSATVPNGKIVSGTFKLTRVGTKGTLWGSNYVIRMRVMQLSCVRQPGLLILRGPAFLNYPLIKEGNKGGELKKPEMITMVTNELQPVSERRRKVTIQRLCKTTIHGVSHGNHCET